MDVFTAAKALTAAFSEIPFQPKHVRRLVELLMRFLQVFPHIAVAILHTRDFACNVVAAIAQLPRGHDPRRARSRRQEEVPWLLGL